ncbi:MAG: A/G-specific adenine glycosylase [Clostridiales bacterium]|nr:A/G-specific adenine glycosylase [Clostridiales bacterium]
MDVEALLSWFYENRRDLPWRSDRTPYGTWISEAMLQQTRVTTVLDYYPRFLKHFPDPESLASASEDSVFKLWEGLGYYSRARNLMRGAKYICEHFDGALPSSPDLLLEIPGIGPYMAGAIASQAFQVASPAVDGNCIRIYCRLHALPLIPSEKSTYNEVYERVRKDIPSDNPGDFNEALMDFGSLVCTPKSPRCSTCPFATECSANLLGKQEDFPLKKPKKETPVEEHTILRIFVGKKILVRKRPDSGLLAGLYELIDMPGHLENHEVEAWVMENLLQGSKECSSEPDIRVLGTSKHVFSHLRWNMLGYEIILPADTTIAKNASQLGELVTMKKYDTLAFASAIRAYR